MTHAELTAAGFDVSEPAYQRLARFIGLLLAENQKLNLTAIRDPAAAWLLHVCDSLAALPRLRTRPAANILDLGTGGGVPGIPLACVLQDSHFTLLDATRKKIAAAERIASGLNLSNVTTRWARAEALQGEPSMTAKFDFVLARAVTATPALLALCAPILKRGGRALLYKTRTALDAESPAASEIAKKAGLTAIGMDSYHLPGYDERVIAVYQRAARS